MKIKEIFIYREQSKISVRNKIKGLFDDDESMDPIFLKRKRSFNIKHEFNLYINKNYGDILSKSDRKKLLALVTKYAEQNEIDNKKDLSEVIEHIGREEDLLLD